MAMPVWGTPGTVFAGTTGTVVSMPTHAAGDILVLVCQTSNEAVTLSDPQGFVEGGSSPQGTGTPATAGSVRMTWFWKRATTNAEPAPTIADPGDHLRSRCYPVSGCIGTGNPWNTTSGGVLATASTAAATSAITTTADGCLVVSLFGHAIDLATGQVSGYSNANLTNTVEPEDGSTGQGTGGGWSVWTGEKATAGSVQATTATLANSSAQAHIVIAFQPPAPGTFTVNPANTCDVVDQVTFSGVGTFTVNPAVSVDVVGQVTFTAPVGGSGLLLHRNQYGD